MSQEDEDIVPENEPVEIPTTLVKVFVKCSCNQLLYLCFNSNLPDRAEKLFPTSGIFLLFQLTMFTFIDAILPITQGSSRQAITNVRYSSILWYVLMF